MRFNHCESTNSPLVNRMRGRPMKQLMVLRRNVLFTSDIDTSRLLQLLKLHCSCCTSCTDTCASRSAALQPTRAMHQQSALLAAMSSLLTPPGHASAKAARTAAMSSRVGAGWRSRASSSSLPEMLVPMLVSEVCLQLYLQAISLSVCCFCRIVPQVFAADVWLTAM